MVLIIIFIAFEICAFIINCHVCRVVVNASGRLCSLFTCLSNVSHSTVHTRTCMSSALLID